MVTPVRKRKVVARLMEVHQVSQRRACDALQIDRSSVRYLSRRGDDADLRDAIKRVSQDRRRFGYRRINVMVAREGLFGSMRRRQAARYSNAGISGESALMSSPLAMQKSGCVRRQVLWDRLRV